MYERFTKSARKVMQLANQEAQRFNHEYLGTEHILVALIKEGCGVAGAALKDLGVNLKSVRLKVAKLVQDGPEMVTIGKLPHTPQAKKIIEYSKEEAHNLNHDYVGTEHILLGLLRVGDCTASNVIKELGLTSEVIHNHVLFFLGSVIKVNPPTPSVGDKIIASIQEFTMVLENNNSKICNELVEIKRQIEALRSEQKGQEFLLKNKVSHQDDRF